MVQYIAVHISNASKRRKQDNIAGVAGVPPSRTFQRTRKIKIKRFATSYRLAASKSSWVELAVVMKALRASWSCAW
jgi:hypothetical protein